MADKIYLRLEPYTNSAGRVVLWVQWHDGDGKWTRGTLSFNSEAEALAVYQSHIDTGQIVYEAWPFSPPLQPVIQLVLTHERAYAMLKAFESLHMQPSEARDTLEELYSAIKALRK